MVFFLLNIPVSGHAEKTYVVGVPELFPPHYLLDDSGRSIGFAIDTFNLISKKAGIKIEYKQFKAWHEIFDAVRDGRVDIIPDVGVSEDRKSFLSFSTPLETFGIGIFVRSGDVKNYDIRDLTGKRIALVKNNIAMKKIQSMGIYETVVFNTNEEALFSLLTAEVDAFCYPIPITLGMVEKAGVADHIRQVGLPITEVERAIGISKSNAALLKTINNVIPDVIHSNAYKEIYYRWHGNPAEFWSAKRIGIFATLAVIFSVILMLFWRYHFVRRTNRQLALTISELNTTKVELEKVNETLELRVDERTNRLLDSQRLLRLATESAMSGIWDWDVARDTIYYSKIWKAQIGYAEDELDNQVSEWESRLHPEDKKARMDDVARFLENPHASDGRLDYEFRLQHKDGTYRWIMNRSRAFYDEAGLVNRMIGCHMDITPIKESEAKIRQQLETLETVLDAFPEKLYVSDIDTYEIIFSNKALNTLFGEDLTGGCCYEILYGADVPCTFCTNSIIENQSEPYSWYHYNEKVKEHFYMIDQMIQWVDGRKVRLEIAINIDDLNKAQKKLEEVNEELESRVDDRTKQLRASNKELEAFAYSVSHDLRAPLRHIKSFVGMLNEHIGEGLDEKSIRYLDIVASSAYKMNLLIDDLLMFSRLNKEPLQKKSFQLDQMVMEIIKTSQLEIQGQRVDWQFELSHPVYGDPRYIKIVLDNLIENAVKYSSKVAVPVIHISVSKNFDETEICVRDNGVGFDMQYADKLFGVFQRLHSEDEYSGNGIGLAMVQRIINRHEGLVHAFSEPEKGTEIKIILPVEEVL